MEASAAMSMAERLQQMIDNPKRRRRGQVPMETVQQALQLQREFVPETVDFNVRSVSDCSDSLIRMKNEKREVREFREMAWEDHVATILRDEEIRSTTTKAKKIAQETAMLVQLKTDKDKWNMAVDLRLTEYLQTTLSVADGSVRDDYLASRNGFGQTPLHRAVKAKDTKLTKVLLDLGAGLTARDDAARSVFHFAAEMGQTDLFRLLVTNCKPEARNVLVQLDSAGFSLLHVIARHGHHEILRIFLDALGLVKLWSILNLPAKKDGSTPLHFAAQNGHAECLRQLLEIKATRSDLRNARGSNALHLALEQNFNIDNLVKIFIETRGSSDDDDTFDCVDDHSGLNCLHTAIVRSYRDVVIALIRTKRIALNTSTREGGWSALHLAVVTEEIPIVKALLEAGAMVDCVDVDGQTPLLQACLGGQLEVVRLLLRAGANPAHQNRQGHSPLHFLSAFCRDGDLLQEVITRGADVSAKSLKLNTPMHFAAMNGNDVATRVLLEHGASANEINEDKRSVVYLAKKWRHRQVEDLVKPPEDQVGGIGLIGGHDGSGHGRGPHFGGPSSRRAAHFTTSGGSQSSSSSGHHSRTRTPATTRSEDSDSDSIYSFEDEEILEPSTPWPTELRTMSRENNGNVSQLQRRQPVKSFGELRRLFMTPDTSADRPPLKPVVLARQKEHHDAEMQAARQLLDASPMISNAQLTRFTRRLLTGPVHIPWEMTVPTREAALTNSSDSALQRRLKPSIRTNIGLLRDHLTHAQRLSWPRYANQRVFRKDDSLPS